MKQAKVLNKEEFKRLVKVVSTSKHAERNRLIVMLSYFAGLRACEIAALKVSDVINEHDGRWEAKSEVVLTSKQTKGKKAQTVIINKSLQIEIEQFYTKVQRLIDKDDFLFNSQKGGGFSSQTIQNLFRSFYLDAGIAHASSHSGRRTFITNLSEKGVSVRVIQELARHSNLATTQRYIDVSIIKLKNAASLVSF